MPESRSEFNEEYGPIELPSVNRLKAMFGGDRNAEKDSSIKRVGISQRIDVVLLERGLESDSDGNVR